MSMTIREAAQRVYGYIVLMDVALAGCVFVFTILLQYIVAFLSYNFMSENCRTVTMVYDILALWIKE